MIYRSVVNGVNVTITLDFPSDVVHDVGLAFLEDNENGLVSVQILPRNRHVAVHGDCAVLFAGAKHSNSRFEPEPNWVEILGYKPN